MERNTSGSGSGSNRENSSSSSAAAAASLFPGLFPTSTHVGGNSRSAFEDVIYAAAGVPAPSRGPFCFVKFFNLLVAINHPDILMIIRIQFLLLTGHEDD